MRLRDKERITALETSLEEYSKSVVPLVGIQAHAALSSLCRQIIDSLHRIEFVERLGERPIDPRRLDPSEALFDPVRAAFLHKHNGDIDEAAWLVFLSTHFGFNPKAGWELTRRVYGALGKAPNWTWQRASTHLEEFRSWFEANANELAGVPFGNHRKYESLKFNTDINLADTVKSYVIWVGANRGFEALLNDVSDKSGNNPKVTFDKLYKGMSVAQFGRTAKFDYLTMIGKLKIADIEPPYPYFNGATGPVKGAKLLLTGSTETYVPLKKLTEFVVNLGAHLDLGMQVMEDSLCNWQKSPNKYTPFRG